MKLYTLFFLAGFVVTLSSVILLLAQVTLQDRVCLTYRNQTGCFEKADNATVFADPSVTKMLNPLLADVDVYNGVADITGTIDPFYSSVMKYINRTLSLVDKELNTRRNMSWTDMEGAMQHQDDETRGLSLPQVIASFESMAECISRGQKPYVLNRNVRMRELLNSPNALIGRDIGVIYCAAMAFEFAQISDGGVLVVAFHIILIIPIVWLGSNVGEVVGLRVGWLLDNCLSLLNRLSGWKWLTLGILYMVELSIWILYSFILSVIVGWSLVYFIGLVAIICHILPIPDLPKPNKDYLTSVFKNTWFFVAVIRGYLFPLLFKFFPSHIFNWLIDLFNTLRGHMKWIIALPFLVGGFSYWNTSNAVLSASIIVLGEVVSGIVFGYIPKITQFLSFLLGSNLDGIGGTSCSNDCLFGKSANGTCQCPPKCSRISPNPDEEPICLSCASLNREYSDALGPACGDCFPGYWEFVKGPKCYACTGPNMILTNNICGCQRGYQLYVSDVFSEPCSQCTSTNRDLERNCTCKAHFDDIDGYCVCDSRKNREEVAGECVCKKNHFEYNYSYCKKCEEMNRISGNGTMCLGCMRGFLEVDGDCLPIQEEVDKCNALFRKMENGQCSGCQGANRTLDRNCDCVIGFEAMDESDWTSSCGPMIPNKITAESKEITQTPKAVAPANTANDSRNDINLFTMSTVALTSSLLVLWIILF